MHFPSFPPQKKKKKKKKKRSNARRRTPDQLRGHANCVGSRIGIRLYLVIHFYFATWWSTAIVLHTISDLGYTVIARIRNQDEAEYALNIHLHEGHPRTSLLKSVAGDALHSLNLIL